MSVRILEGDCLSVMPTLDADSIDAIVCDPPYGLKFMGKEWDHGVPGIPFWEAANRVARPGAYLLAFGGTRTHHRLMCAIEDAGWELRDCLMWLHGQGFPKGKAQLKPAWEPVIMARKKGPLQPLNINGCRIGTEGGMQRDDTTTRVPRGDAMGAYLTRAAPVPGLGRWPANLILDEISAALIDEQSGDKPASFRSARTGSAKSGWGMTNDGQPLGHTDTGGASRFFYTAKASRSEREAGLEHQRKAPGGSNAKGYTEDVARGLDRNRPVGNHHPTVKPLDLMQWLCRLVTPKGGLILDPFCGSGTTGRAAVAEGFSFIGIELDPEYAAIAQARIAEYAPLFGDVA